MMTPAKYTGPERRDDGLLALQEHIDRRLEEHKAHFDNVIREKVDPMYDYFITARTGAAIIKWVLAVVGSLAGAWVVAKGWIVK